MQSRENITSNHAQSIFRDYYPNTQASFHKMNLPFWWIDDNIILPGNSHVHKLNITPKFKQPFPLNNLPVNIEPVDTCLKYSKNKKIKTSNAVALSIPYYQFTFQKNRRNYHFFVNASTGYVDDELDKSKHQFVFYVMCIVVLIIFSMFIIYHLKG